MNADSSAKFQPVQPCKKPSVPSDYTSDSGEVGSLALLHLHHNSEVDNLTIPCRTEYPIFINHDPMLQEVAMVRTPILGAVHDDHAAPVGAAWVQAITTDNEELNHSLPQSSGGLQGSSPLLPSSNNFAAKIANEDQVPPAAGWPAQQLALPPPPVSSPPGDEDVLQDFLMEMTRPAPAPILKTSAKNSCASSATEVPVIRRSGKLAVKAQARALDHVATQAAMQDGPLQANSVSMDGPQSHYSCSQDSTSTPQVETRDHTDED
jgi:hypothetical protein